MHVLAALIAVLGLGRAGLAQQAARAQRADLKIVVPAEGAVEAREVLRLRASMEGRAEEVTASPGSWVLSGKSLGSLANKEMADLFDSRTNAKGELEKRWKSVYKPTPIHCPGDCFVLRVFISPKEWLKPKALLFEVAQKLTLTGKAAAQDAAWVKDGQILEFWPAAEPNRRFKLPLRGCSGGTFAMDLSPSNYLEPGTAWKGEIVPARRKNVLAVPTQALIRHGSEVYLPVKVSAGLSTESLTEITSGLEDKRQILVLGDVQLGKASRHKPGPEREEPVQVIESRQDKAAGPRGGFLSPVPEADSSEEDTNAQ
ncbi:MAG: hypothetical protein HY921_11415 [Elusimicrobia bacterium]|nr:hypothetical protein [Elusimicrobiota bacterium]